MLIIRVRSVLKRERFSARLVTTCNDLGGHLPQSGRSTQTPVTCSILNTLERSRAGTARPS